DWALVCTLRDWFERQDAGAPGWYRGPSDPVVGPALEAMHAGLATGWTVASLAAEAGVSRALFARRFTEVMGQSPLAYLTHCRMDDAEELLADHSRTVAQVAKRVGYADAFGFSAAFKPHRGLPPSEVRPALSAGGTSEPISRSAGYMARGAQSEDAGVGESASASARAVGAVVESVAARATMASQTAVAAAMLLNAPHLPGSNLVFQIWRMAVSRPLRECCRKVNPR